MVKLTAKSGDILVVEVPEDTTWWKIDNNDMGKFITETLNLNEQFLLYGKHSKIFGEDIPNQVYYNPNNFYLPEGKWEILGKLSEITNKDCEEFVEKHPNIAYRDYMASTLSKAVNGWTANWSIQSAKQSFISLLQSENIDTNKEWLLIKLI